MDPRFFNKKSQTHQAKRLSCQRDNNDKENIATCWMETLPMNSILSFWERSGIINGRGILKDLGFHTDKINITQLKQAMKKKMAYLRGEQQNVLLKAYLVLQTEELCSYRNLSEQLLNANAKLKGGNKDEEMKLVIKENDNLKCEQESMQILFQEMLEKMVELNRELSKTKHANSGKELESTTNKRKLDSPSETQLNEEYPRGYKIRKCISDEHNFYTEAAANSPQNLVNQTSIQNTKNRISSLEEELKKTEEQLLVLSSSTSVSLEETLRIYKDFEVSWKADKLNKDFDSLSSKYKSQTSEFLETDIEELCALLNFYITDSVPGATKAEAATSSTGKYLPPAINKK